MVAKFKIFLIKAINISQFYPKIKVRIAKNKSFYKEAKLIQNLHLKNKKFYELILINKFKNMRYVF